MLKSLAPVKTPRGRVKKHLSYREAWARINAALEQEFFLEAVTIEESIISDRLVSYLIEAQAINRSPDDHHYPSFGRLVQLWAIQVTVPIAERPYTDLQTAVDQWRKDRNRVVHALVKSYPDREPEEVSDFLSNARRTAEEGKKLARAVSEWRKRVRQRLPPAF